MLTAPPTPAVGGLVLVCGRWVEEGLKLRALGGAEEGLEEPPDRGGRGGVTVSLEVLQEREHIKISRDL